MVQKLALPEFRSWQSYSAFVRSVRQGFRYMHDAETIEFLDTVLVTSESRKVVVPKGRIFWRAQLGHDWRVYDEEVGEIRCAHPRARMKPLPGRASDGRANAKGIPCLYLATTKEAAMSEVRPWIGSFISAAQFRTTRPLTIIDCGREQGSSLNFFFEEPPSHERTKAVWADIDRAFSEPMTRADDQADYAPTQILAELFKRASLDGVAYRSNFGEDGFNISLFNPDDAELINCGLFEVKKISPTFDIADNFYFVSEPKT